MDGSAIQIRNDDLVNLLRPEFQARNEPNFAFKSLISLFQNPMALRGLWHAGSMDQNTDMPDLSGHGQHAYGANTPTLNHFLPGTATVEYSGGVAEWHVIHDSPYISITGLETEVASSRRGLSTAGWYRIDQSQTNRGLIGKWDSSLGNYRGWLLYISGTVRPNFTVSSNGVVSVSVPGNIWTSFNDRFWFLGATFKPSSYIRLYVGDSLGNWEIFETVAGVPASIFNTPADMYIASYQNGTAAQGLDGRFGIGGVWASYSDDSFMRMLWDQSRMIYRQT